MMKMLDTGRCKLHWDFLKVSSEVDVIEVNAYDNISDVICGSTIRISSLNKTDIQVLDTCLAHEFDDVLSSKNCNFVPIEELESAVLFAIVKYDTIGITVERSITRASNDFESLRRGSCDFNVICTALTGKRGEWYKKGKPCN